MEPELPRRGMPKWLPERPVVVVQQASDARPDQQPALQVPGSSTELHSVNVGDLAPQVSLRIELNVRRDLIDRLVALVGAIAAGTPVVASVGHQDVVGGGVLPPAETGDVRYCVHVRPQDPPAPGD